MTTKESTTKRMLRVFGEKFSIERLVLLVTFLITISQTVYNLIEERAQVKLAVREHEKILNTQIAKIDSLNRRYWQLERRVERLEKF